MRYILTPLAVATAALLTLTGCASSASLPVESAAVEGGMVVEKLAEQPTPREMVSLEGLPELTWSSIDAELRTAPETELAVSDWDACTVDEPTAVHYTSVDATAGVNPAGLLAPELFTGVPQVVPCVETATDDVLEVMLPARGAEAQSYGSIHDSTVTVADQTAHVTVNGTTLTIHRDGVEPVSFEVALGSDEAPTPTGQTYIQAVYDDPSEEATSGEAFGMAPGSFHLVLTGAFSPAPDPAGDARRVHFGIHPWNASYGPTTGCVGILDPVQYDAVLDLLPVGTVIEVRP